MEAFVAPKKIVKYRDNRTRKNFKKIEDGSVITVYDTETTGLDRDNDDIVQFAAKQYSYLGGKWLPGTEINMYIKPKKPIPPEVSEKNHITNDMVESCPYIEDVFDTISSILDADFWAGHNIIGFDNRFMKRVFDDMDYELPDGYFNSLDTLDASIDLVSHDDCGKYNLASMCEFFGIEEDATGTAGFHDALYDVRQCAALGETLHEMYKTATFEEDGGNPKIIPKIYTVREWKASEKSYKKGNFIVVNSDCGRFYYNKWTHTWSGEINEKAVCIQNIIEATYQKLGLCSDNDLFYWKPEPKLEGPEKYADHPEDWPINFGKYKGQKLGDIVATREGYNYLVYMYTKSDWLASPYRKAIKDAIGRLLLKDAIGRVMLDYETIKAMHDETPF